MTQIIIPPASPEAMSKLADWLFDKMFAPKDDGKYPIFPSFTEYEYDPAWSAIYAYVGETDWLASLTYEERDIFAMCVYYSNYWNSVKES